MTTWQPVHVLFSLFYSIDIYHPVQPVIIVGTGDFYTSNERLSYLVRGKDKRPLKLKLPKKLAPLESTIYHYLLV